LQAPAPGQFFSLTKSSDAIAAAFAASGGILPPGSPPLPPRAARRPRARVR
jgi:hypothetical protein